MAKDKRSEKQVEEFLTKARKRFKIAEEAEEDIRKEAVSDLKFRIGEQWDELDLHQRKIKKQPTLTINRLPQHIKQIANEMRQNRPSILVSPVDDNADKDTAKIFKGIIRNIEYTSNAHAAYDYALTCALERSFGYWRITSDYSSPKSFDQDLLIKRIKNPFSVYLDPSYSEPDGSDADWGFIFEDMDVEDYKRNYPNSKMASMDDFASVGGKVQGWAGADTIRLAEYYYKEFEQETLCLMEDGSTILKKELDPDYEQFVVDERETTITTVKWAKINACEILEETVWPSKWIPIIPVLGDEIDVEGKKVLESLIRQAKDPQKMLNFWASAETEAIASAPKAPFVGYAGQFKGFEKQWRTANIENHAYLEVNPKMVGGQPAPLPQRMNSEPAVMAITNARMNSAEDIKAATGVYDAALGARSNEVSGIAINRRVIQAQTSNFHFIDNFMRSLKHTGRILVELIPKYYDTERTVRIIGEDDEKEIVKRRTKVH